MYTMTFPKYLLQSFCLLLLLIGFTTCQSTDQKVAIDTLPSDILLTWNEKVMALAKAEDKLLTLKGVRTEAMMHVAIHDVLNAIQPTYDSYAYHETSSKADPMAAVAQTAYEIVLSQFPDQQVELQGTLHKWLDKIDNDEAKLAGIKIGKQAASSIIKERENDDFNNEAEYSWHPMAPGVYAEFNEHSGTPEGFIFGAGWAKAKPFLLKKPDQFRSPPPPEIDSEVYTTAFEEVKTVGRFKSETRTADQGHLAMWWKDFVEHSHNKLARELIKKENINLLDAARLFALLNMTIYDAYVNVFDNKFHYNHWRPYTAIRWAANDENANTTADTTWTNLHNHTYAFPSYPSAHGTASSAAMKVLANTLGKGDNYRFTMSTDSVDSAGPFSPKVYMDPPTRSFESFSAAGLEASLSRIYLGIHFRYDSEEGHRLGNNIGTFTTSQFLNPRKPK